MDFNSFPGDRKGCILVIVLVALPAYLFLVRLLGYRRASEIKLRFGCGRNLATMTSTEAFEIMRGLQELEFPSSFRTAMALALIKVTGAAPSKHAISIDLFLRLPGFPQYRSCCWLLISLVK